MLPCSDNSFLAYKYLKSELQIVVSPFSRHKPTECVVEPRGLGVAMLPVDMPLLVKAHEPEYGILEILAVGLQEGSRFRPALDVLGLYRCPEGVQRRRADDPIVGHAGGLVDVELVVGRAERGTLAGEQVAIGLTLGKVAGGVRVVGIQLMVDANHVVSAVQSLLGAPVQLWSGREHIGEACAHDISLEAGEEVKLVSNNRSADRAAPLVLVGVGLPFPRLLGEDRRRGHGRVRQVPERGSAKGVAPPLRDGVHDAACRPTEFDVELVGLDLEFFNRLQGRSRLRPRGGGRVVVCVVPAVEHKGDLVAALTVDADRIGPLRAWVQLDPGNHGDERDEVACRRRQIQQLTRSHVPPDNRGGQVNC